MTTLGSILSVHLSCEEASGARADDVGGTSFTSNNSVGRATGKVGFAAQFDAASSRYLSHASNSTLQANDHITICAWVKLASIPSDGTAYTIVGKDVDSPASSRDYTLDYLRDDAHPTAAGFRFYINGSAGLATSGTSGFSSTGVWYFLIASYDPDAVTNSLSVNGGTPVTVSNGGAAQTSSAEFRIGARAYSGFEGFADALIDQVAIFKGRQLNASERAFLYNQGSGRSYAEIMAAPTMPLVNLDLSLARYSGNPIINHTGGGSWYVSQIYDFVVLPDPADSAKLLMYVSGMAAPTEFGVQSIGLFHGTVANPYVWTEHGGTGNGQVLQGTGVGGDFDETSVRLGSVVYDSGTFYLYYTAYDGGSQRIGLATSSDGVSFTRYGSNPIVTPAGNGHDDGANLEEFYVVKEGSAWSAVYCVFDGSTIQVRAATSSDGLAWTKTATGNILGARPDTSTSLPQWHQIRVKDSLVSGLYAMIYEDGGILDADTNVYKIRVATSPQVIGPYTPVTTPEPLLAGSGVGGTFDQKHVATPCLVNIGGREYLFFCGTAATGAFEGNWSAGVATTVAAATVLFSRTFWS